MSLELGMAAELVDGPTPGWRAFNLDRGAGSLRSLGSREWEPGMQARCLNTPGDGCPQSSDGRAPGEHHPCGYYAYLTREDVLRRPSMANGHVYAEVQLLGKVIRNTYSRPRRYGAAFLRGEYLEIVRLFVGHERNVAAAERVAHRLGVPLDWCDLTGQRAA